MPRRSLSSRACSSSRLDSPYAATQRYGNPRLRSNRKNSLPRQVAGRQLKSAGDGSEATALVKTASYWIDKLGLIPHPEGGHFRESYRATLAIDANALAPEFAGERA